MDTPTLIQSDVTLFIFTYQAHHEQKLKEGPGNVAIQNHYSDPRGCRAGLTFDSCMIIIIFLFTILC